MNYQIFSFSEAFQSSVDLGSETKIEFPVHTLRANILRREAKKVEINPASVPKIGPEKDSFVHEGETYHIDRSLIRYEALEEIISDLPEFVQDLLNPNH